MLESPMDASVRVRGYTGNGGDKGGGWGPDGSHCLCFCSNNYLGLANHPEVVEAGLKGLRDYGAGTASVRFICGTFSPHEALEQAIARYMGTEASYSFVSCWNANEAIFPTLCEAGDMIISDELNHASIIDAIRLAGVIKKGLLRGVYKHNDLAMLRTKLEEAKANPEMKGQIWVVTDGVFSMEGDIADLPAMRKLCDEFDAMLVVDDSHGHGVMGETGRGTHEYWGMVGAVQEATEGRSHEGTKGGSHERKAPSMPSPSSLRASDPSSLPAPSVPSSLPQIDLFTGTLGKALGGAAGGFVAGPRRAIELLIQRGRPTLFSNALPVSVACSATKAIEILMKEPQRVARLRDNCTYARTKIREAGFTVIDSPTAICPIIVHDTAKAIAMSRRLLELGVFVIGFGFPVVPEGHARLRVQISAAHDKTHIDGLVAALKRL
ncbi:MAG: aminotransferase class I/II-fold pyridoxal phosphate-dependent enzyme [Pyrinomonadaceae bacterium]|nr:aminotransferase class I/II-fold pyridoxal phosphate-dependent enzyme [Phycisphaerales bacterium]